MPESIVVENSQQSAAIGDTLASFPALMAYAWRADKPITVWLSSAACRPLLPAHHNINQVEERPKKPSKILDIQAIAKRHIRSGFSMSQGYMEEIGLADSAKERHPELTIDIGPQPETISQFQVLLAPFSHSDNGTNTKIWPDSQWDKLITYLRQKGLSIGLLGVESDMTDFWRQQPIKPLLGRPLRSVGWLLMACGFVISTDNGINWMAQAVKAKHILLLPGTAHPGWTGNRTGKALMTMVSSPAEVVMQMCNKILANDFSIPG